MLFSNYPVIIRGGGDLATGAAYRLVKSGFPVLIFELAHPLVIRRRVAFATAVLEGEIVIEDLLGRLVGDLEEAHDLARSGAVPVLIQPELPMHSAPNPAYNFPILIDARMAKRNIDTEIGQAPLVISLGPGFTAGEDCNAVIETNRGHRLGRVLWDGSAQPDTGSPGIIDGKGAERVLRAPANGSIQWHLDIGNLVQEGELLGQVAQKEIVAPFEGVIRGLIAPGTTVWKGLKVGDIDPRANQEASFTISDKALSVGGGVLEAVLTWLNSKGNEVEINPK